MHALHKQLQNSLTRERDARDRAHLKKTFPALQSCSDPHFLSLRQYLDGRPNRFYDETAYKTYLDRLQSWHKKDESKLRDYLDQYKAEINRAILFLREINSENWHDRQLKTGDEYDLVRFIDKHVHPTYLRLVEAIFAPLIRPIAYFSRLDRGKSTEGLSVWSVVEELKFCKAQCMIRPYSHIIRNGIAHGGIMFLQNKISYRDNNGNEETFNTEQVVRLVDDLLDTCNGLIAALKVFFVIYRDKGYSPPRELFIEELQEETSTPWWTIEGCVESEIVGSSQLMIYARPNSRDYKKIHFSTIQSGILAEYFAPGYDRYFFSLRTHKAWPGWASFDGNKLRSLREEEVDSLLEYQGIVENNLVFYVPRPKMPAIFGKLDTLVMSFRISKPLIYERMRAEMGYPAIITRNSSIHRNSWGTVLRAEVVIENLTDDTAIDLIRSYKRRIIKLAIKHARRQHRLSTMAYLPLGYAQVSIFRKDYRRRRLMGFGLSSDLVCTLRLQRIQRIKSPDIMGSTVETTGNWRIAWNKEWLEVSGQDPTQELKR